MSDRNRNRENQSFKSNEDWDRIRDRNDQENDYDRYASGNVSRKDYDYTPNRNEYRNTGNYESENRPYTNYNRDWERNQNYGNYSSAGNRRNYDYDRDYQNYGQYGSSHGNYNPGYETRDARYGDSNYRYNAYGRHENRGARRNYDQNRDWFDRASDEVASWFGDEDAERRRRIDKVTGPHKGKGPRGYQRSDERIREDVNDRLTEDPYIDASEIEVKVSERCVILSGSVPTREEKRRAEDLAESIAGVSDIENHIHVTRSESTDKNWNRNRTL